MVNDYENERLLYQIRALEKMIGRLFFCQELENHKNLPTPTQMQIIEYILKHPNENIYQRDLENILSLRRATVCGVLQTMEKNQFILRTIDTNDSRIKKIILNDSAKDIYLTYEKKILEIEEILKHNLTDEEINIFLDIMKKMQNNLYLITKKESKYHVKID